MSPSRRVSSLATVAALLAVAPGARADDVEACAQASEKGQLLRLQGKLDGARKEFLACMADACPALVKKDCAQFLEGLEAAQPTIVLAAREPGGGDLVEVEVALDGASFAAKLDGKAVRVDPGPHELVFRAPGRVEVRLKVLVKEGEKSRVVEATMPRIVTDAPKAAPPSPWLGFVAGGVALVGFGGFIGFGLAARSDVRALEDRCGTRCPTDDVDRARRKALFADVSLGLALVATGVSIYGFVRSRPDERTLSSVTVGPGWATVRF